MGLNTDASPADVVRRQYLASAAGDDRERYALVDKANEVRRWTRT